LSSSPGLARQLAHQFFKHRYTKKRKENFPHIGIQNGSGAKSYMTNGLLIYG
jgi:hypothetical protein